MRMLLAGLLAALIAVTAAAEGERAGEFDYYVVSLSWSPNWCLREGDARDSPQCEKGTGHGWILHGLWPQFHRGYPSFCQTAERPPTRRMTRDMADIMGTSGLAWHQWKKHGTCTGLSATSYYALSRDAYARVTRPEIFRKLKRHVRLPATVVEDAFLQSNPAMEADGVTITCRADQIHEARICLSKSLDPVPCGQDVVRDCKLKKALFAPVR
ncbi:ribonuclease T [Sulfitobacter sp. JBTF-M27]|uniref:Ribonuclease T n=1 Tax=Sulfitobacter sediminilitoris TaxID=2698830 RepID=A0A6P0CA99_9RHOB|nr:ribonuclease T2 [Sulfitobacter sediminilitoris]NEK23151.1 ribonuclease T [Sulfitobacter sediminilitoris]